jgi:hypothetical protein
MAGLRESVRERAGGRSEYCRNHDGPPGKPDERGTLVISRHRGAARWSKTKQAMVEPLLRTSSAWGAGSTPAQGRVLWRLPLPAQTGPPSLAALDTTGGLSILLAGVDGFVYAVR